MSAWTKRENARKRARSLSAEAQRHLRNAKKARIREAQARLDAALVACEKRSYMDPETDLANAETCINQARDVVIEP